MRETKAKTVTLGKDILKQIESRAKEENRNSSNMIETMCIWYLKHKRKNN